MNLVESGAKGAVAVDPEAPDVPPSPDREDGETGAADGGDRMEEGRRPWGSSRTESGWKLRRVRRAARFFALPYSPWSEKARWALDHHGVAYRELEHVPLLGEALLRLRAGHLRPSHLRAGHLGQKATVPLLVDDGDIFDDSFAIARHAEATGAGHPLMPTEHRPIIETWNARSEIALAAGRALLLARCVGNGAMQRENLPAFVPRWIRPPMRPLAALGVRYVAGKHAATAPEEEPHLERLGAVLATCRAALAGREYLLGEFTYADVAVAAALQFVDPVADAYLPLGTASRAGFATPVLANEFQDLLRYRDRLYARHRPHR